VAPSWIAGFALESAFGATDRSSSSLLSGL
jgi:hypothetical protein